MTSMSSAACPCGSGQVYDDCCGRFHHAEASAPTAEVLMRSRFSAFAMGDAHYLGATWHPSTRPDLLELDADRRWTRLLVLSTSGGGVFDSAGTVQFAAHYELAGRRGVQQENSTFVREQGRWFYLGAIDQGA